MSTVIAAPKAPITLGLVTLPDGVTYEVRQHPEFVRFFFDIMRRIGGVNAMTNVELQELVQSASLAPLSPPSWQQSVPVDDITPPAPVYAAQQGEDMAGRVSALEAQLFALAGSISDLQVSLKS